MWMLGPHAGIHYRPNDPIAEAVEAALRGYRFDRGRGLIDLWVSVEIGPNQIDRSLRLVDRGNIRRNQALDLRAGQLPNGVLVGKQKRLPLASDQVPQVLHPLHGAVDSRLEAQVQFDHDRQRLRSRLCLIRFGIDDEPFAQRWCDDAR